MGLRLEGVVVLVGSYGSGKSEVAVNLAIHHRQAGMEVRIADLDLVNPYFRSREAEAQLTGLGIDVVLPPRPYVQSELPVLSPRVSGLIRRAEGLTLLDAGGDQVGATVLAALGDAFAGRSCQVLHVINPLRPDTGSVAGCMRIQRQIEASAKRAITGLIGNANLIDETTPQVIVDGYAFVKEVCAACGLPLVFVTVTEELLAQVDPAQFDCPVLTIRRQLVPPWKRACKL
ncbi:MAG: cobalamin biosynthesis protein CbiA [Desulfobacterales bacterium]|nr:cobalamin biosynthesis protein CbiA [Desulfobacterales bacterium]